MPRRKLRRVAAVAGLALTVAVVLALWPRAQPDRATRENLDRVRKGMSRAEVYAILGPPGDYTTGPMGHSDGHAISVWNVNATRLHPSEIDDPADWLTDSGWVCVNFDDRGMVAETGFDPCTKVPQGPLDNLLWRMRRQWWRWFPE
jgi:hypothetical protein